MKCYRLIVLGGIFLLIFSMGIVAADENTTDVVDDEYYNAVIIAENISEEYDSSGNDILFTIEDLSGNPVDDANPTVTYDNEQIRAGYDSDHDYSSNLGTYVLDVDPDVGNHNVKIELNTSKYCAEPVLMNVNIYKAPTTALVFNINTKIGAKETIIGEILDKNNVSLKISGKAQFKLAGKTYSVKIVNGIAKCNVKLPLKAKTYTGTFKFLGNKNYKASSTKFNVKLNKGNVAILKQNRNINIGKYTIKLTSSQYKSLVKAFNKGKSKTLNIKTGYNQNVKVSYTETVKKYKITTVCKTLYGGVYLPAMEEMESAGWKKVSEYTYTKENPRNQEGLGLSAYTYAVTKWVKISHKTAYKTKSVPVKAKIIYKNSLSLPKIKIYSNGKVLNNKYLAIA